MKSFYKKIKNVKTQLIALSVACTFFFTAMDTVADTTPDAVVSLSKLLSVMETFQGDFSQVITDEDNEVVEENSGEFLLKRPGLFRWHIKPPFEKLMVSNNKTLWTYDPELQQATADPVDDRLLQTPMLLLSGDLEQIRTSYTVSIVESQLKSTDKKDKKTLKNVTRYKLIPNGDDNLFESMEMTFKDGRVIGMSLLSELGEKQVYVFTKTTLNKKIKDSEFSFDIPPNVDVIVND